MTPIRPQPYPQRGTGTYNAGNEAADKDGHNQNGQEQRQQGQNVIARGRAEDVQQQTTQNPIRPAIYSPAVNAYAQNSINQPIQGQ